MKHTNPNPKINEHRYVVTERFRHALETGGDWLTPDEERAFRGWPHHEGPRNSLDFGQTFDEAVCEVTGKRECCVEVLFCYQEPESLL